MSTYATLFRSLGHRVEQGHRVGVCTLVGTIGSAPQVAGAMMLLHEDMTTEGTLGGGCVETDVCRQAYELLRRGESAILTFSLDHDYGWDDSLICGGKMDIAVMPVSGEREVAPFLDAAATLEQGRSASVKLRVQHQGQPQEYCLHIEAPARLLIAGAGHIGAEVARLATALDFDVRIIDDRGDVIRRNRLPEPIKTIEGDIAATLRGQEIDANTFVVIVTRGHKHDEAALHAVIDSKARYIGMIGSRRKIKLVFEDLLALGVDAKKLERVHAPIGLPIAAVTVPEIAVSIIAELVQVRRTEKPTHVEGPAIVASRSPSGPCDR
ncbi:MAG TPA: XdhC family protein [Phycisphaerae bacterium]|nr:XdhC family protein [Phycisphaerae bacterium]